MSYTIYKHTLILDCPHKGWSYIGQTHFKNVKIRWNSGKNYKTSRRFYNAIQKYGWNSFEHTILETNIKTRAEANKLEKYYIKFYNTIENGYNISSGGDDHTYNAKEIYQLDENKNILAKFSSLLAAEDATGIQSKNIYRVCTGKNKSVGGYYWCYAEKYNEWTIEKSKKLIPIKPIYQMTLDGKIIAKFNSMSEAIKILNFKSCSKISMCCNKKRKTAYGFRWRYVDEERKSKN